MSGGESGFESSTPSAFHLLTSAGRLVETSGPINSRQSSSHSAAVEIRPLRPEEHDAAAALIHRSLVHWYETRLGEGSRFGPSPTPFRIFPAVYAALDPGEAMAAVERNSGNLIGLAFVHPRPTHIAVGIVAVAPEAQDRGVAHALLRPVAEKARQSGRPMRLVSSLANLDSFSLYSSLGFVPHTFYQEMTLAVPKAGMAHPAPRPRASVCRVSDPREASRFAQLEFELQGLQRERDYAFLLGSHVGEWRMWRHGGTQGKVDGFLVVSLNADYIKLGPGIARDEEIAGDLLWHALDSLRGESPTFLVPSHASSLVRQCYVWSARNIELYAAQATAGGSRGHGVTFPSFLPETG